MKCIQTEKQKLLSPQPTLLDTLREIDKRQGLDPYPKYKDQLYRLEKGQEGEEKLIHYLQTYGAPHWTILRNLWLEHFGEFECDLLLLTRLGPIAFEIKNYSGQLTLQNNQYLLNGKVIGHNPFSQAQKVVTNLSNLLQTPLEGVLAFAGAHNPVELHDDVSGIDVLMRSEFPQYIRQLAQKERQARPIDTTTLLKKLAPFEIGRPSKEKTLPGEIKTGVRRGIRCCHCSRFDLEIRKNYVICPCGMHEPREEAIVRTICEYGVIYPERELTTQALTDFFAGEISKSTVFRYLTKHFKQTGTYRSVKYQNPQRVFNQQKPFFHLTEPKYMWID